jgi:oligopeptide transport system substrate-binding protein
MLELNVSKIIVLSGAGVFLSIPALLFFVTNNPYPDSYRDKNYFHSAFFDAPRTLDPARNEGNNIFLTWSIYEPPLQYHFLKRPFELTPLTATSLPDIRYLDFSGKELSADAPAERIARGIYTFHIKPGIRFQNHPCFARDESGALRYHLLKTSDLLGSPSPNELPECATRELVAADFVWQLKRLALPGSESPATGILHQSCLGFTELSDALREATQNQVSRDTSFLDLDRFDFPGAKVIDKYTYQVILKRKYPQFIYWFATPHFAPMPREADAFFAQRVVRESGYSLDNSPVGTGPYRLEKFDTSSEIILTRNENFRDERFPEEGELTDKPRGYLDDAGKTLPFIDKAIYRHESEQIPRWIKFRQGYYDISLLVSENFESSVEALPNGEFSGNADLVHDGIVLHDVIHPVLIYFSFNMKDPVVGGYSEKNRKLRQALSIALDPEAFNNLFRNGRDIPAQGPIPPGQFGTADGKDATNSFLNEWDSALHQPRRKSLAVAKHLLAEAGYPNGVGSNGRQLVITFSSTYSTSERPLLEWLRGQFSQINVDLQIHAQDAGRLMENINKGHFQLLRWAWQSRNPDPESFLFPFYGPNAKAAFSSNMSHYDREEFNRLYEQMEPMVNGLERTKIINRMIQILQEDCPWIFVSHLKEPLLSHAWVTNEKPLPITAGWGGAGVLKYRRIDPVRREEQRTAWNAPSYAWLLLPHFLIFLGGIVVYQQHKRMDQRTAFKSTGEVST